MPGFRDIYWDLGINYSLIGWICVSRFYRRQHFRKGEGQRKEEGTHQAAREELTRANIGVRAETLR